MIEFPYQREKSNILGEVYRPICEFEIKTPIFWIPVYGYIDSGADITLLPKQFINAFGIDVRERDVKEIKGLGEGKIPVILKKIKIKIGTLTFDALISISLVSETPYILGRKDVFEHFTICFDQTEGIVKFEEKKKCSKDHK